MDFCEFTKERIDDYFDSAVKDSGLMAHLGETKIVSPGLPSSAIFVIYFNLIVAIKSVKH